MPRGPLAYSRVFDQNDVRLGSFDVLGEDRDILAPIIGEARAIGRTIGAMVPQIPDRSRNPQGALATDPGRSHLPSHGMADVGLEREGDHSRTRGCITQNRVSQSGMLLDVRQLIGGAEKRRRREQCRDEKKLDEPVIAYRRGVLSRKTQLVEKERQPREEDQRDGRISVVDPSFSLTAVRLIAAGRVDRLFIAKG